MKKYFILFAAICAAVAVSCTPKELVIDTPAEEGVSDVKLIPITITASLEGTKADMVDVKWTWQSGDKLAVYDGTAKREFTLDESAAGTAVAKFTGEVAETFTSLQAVFPYAAAGASFGTPLIPAVQTVASGTTIDPAAMIAIAETAEKVSDDEFNFYFTSGVSMLRFTVPDGVQKVILHTEGKEAAIAGESRSVTVSVPGAGQYWAAVNPAAYEGMKVFARTSNGDLLKSTTSTIDLSAPGKAKNLGTLGAGGTSVSVIEDGAELVSYLGSTPTLDAYVVNDLDLTDKTVTTCASFAKVFDGLYHSIKNWTSNGVALFDDKTEGVIKNINIDSTCNLTPTSGNFGFLALALINNGAIIGCSNAANVTYSLGEGTTQHCFGFFTGRLITKTTKITDCKNTGNLTISFTTVSTDMKTQYIGSMVGMVAGPNGDIRLENCTNEGIITVNGTNSTGETHLRNIYLGGLFGGTGVNKGTTSTPTGYTKKYGTIKNCLNKGKVEATWTGGTGGYFRVGGIGGYAEAAFDSCINEGSVSFTNSLELQTAGSAVGGICSVIAGTSSINAIDCLNKGAISFIGRFSTASVTTITTTDPDTEEETKTEYALNDALVGCKYPAVGGCFGVVGDNSTKIQNCSNEGTISVTWGKDSAAPSMVGGVVAFSFCAPKSCTNSGNITYNGGKMSKQVYLSGIVAWLDKKATIDGCENTGDITAENWTNSSFSYIGGVMGNYNATKSTIQNCSNSGKLTSTATAKMRMGGIAAALYGTMKNCINTGDIECTNAQAGSRFGGLMGYSSAPITGGSTDCNITVTGNTATGHAGLLCGDIARTNTVSGVTVGGTITTDASIKAGFLFGGYNSTSNVAIYTLGTDSAPLIIDANANINGTCVVSNPSAISDVVGDTQTNASASHNMIFTNVVVE